MDSRKNASGKTASSVSQDDVIIYKILIALIAGCAGYMLTRILQVNIGTKLLCCVTATRITSIVSAAVLAVCIIAGILKHTNKVIRRLCIGIGIASFALLFGALTFCVIYDNGISMIYFGYVGGAVLYCMYLLYQRDFFWISMVTACAGFLFYYISVDYYPGCLNFRSLVLLIAFVILMIAVCILTFRCSRNNGHLTICRWKALSFNVPLSPASLYVTCALWAACLIAVLICGALFSYVCMFAAIAYELVCICYFTIKLM